MPDPHRSERSDPLEELLVHAREATVQRRWLDALEHWSHLCRLRPDDMNFQLSRGTALFELRRLEESLAVFEDIQRRNPNELRAIVGLINIAEAKRDWDTALALWRRGLELHPQASGAIRKVVRLLVLAGRDAEAEAMLAERADQMTPADRLLASADVLKPGRSAALMSMLEEHAELVARTETLRDHLLPALLELGDIGKAVAIWLGPDPSEVRQARARTMLAVRATDWGNGETIRLLYGVWKKFGAAVMGAQELPLICNAVVNMEGVPAALAMLRVIDQRPVTVPGDVKLKMLALFERVALGELDDPRAAILDMVVRYDQQLPLGHLRQTIEGLITRFDAVQAAFSSTHLDTGLHRRSALAVLERIITSFEQSRPLSFVRLGDAEGMFLPYPADYRQYAYLDRDSIQTHAWGAPRLSPAESDSIAAEFTQVVQRADIVGIFDFQFCCQNLPVPTVTPLHLYGKFCRGILSVLDNSLIFAQSAVNQPDRMLTSTILPFDFETHGLYDVLFKVVRQVSVITCHARLAPYLRERFGLQIADEFLIPQHAKHNATFRYDARTEHHYPQVFRRLRHELSQRDSQGQVTLVAAGLLGKFYCDWIKQAGGIALDIGSLADYWCGFSTRHVYHARVRRTA